MSAIDVNGKSVELDGEGYLANFNEWNKDVARALAKDQSIEITDDHWVVLQLLRDYYSENENIPTARDLVRSIGEKLGNEKGNNRFLSTLFPHDQLKQGSKIAGLPRMPGCT